MEEALPILDEIWSRINMNKVREGAWSGIVGKCRMGDKATSMRVITRGKVPIPDRVGLQFSRKPVINSGKRRV